MSVKLLIEHHLELLGLKGGCTGSSESTLVKIPHCWKSRVTAQIIFTMSIDNVIAKLMAALNKDHGGLYLHSFKDNLSACNSQRH